MRPINRCLNKQLLDICQRNVQISSLNEKLQQFLPLTLKGHCQVGNFNKGCLTIITKNTVWATELRYSLPDLRDRFRKDASLHQLATIKITIDQEKAFSESKPIMSPTNLSLNACEAIRAAADGCQYLPLKKALYQLAAEKLAFD